jgi:hypothetical protein
MKDESKINKRGPGQMESDKLFIAGLLVKSVTIREITRRLNEHNTERGYSLSHVQVYKDIKSIYQEWKEAKNDLIDTKMDLELAKLDKMEDECWDAWERSKEGKRKTVIEGGQMIGSQLSGGTIKEREIETTFGDTKFLDIIQRCMEKRAALLGLNAPTKILAGVVNGIGSMTREDIEREITETWKTKI